MPHLIILHDPQDPSVVAELRLYLDPLLRRPGVTSWDVTQVEPGMPIATECDRQLAKADLILLLLTQGFIAAAPQRALTQQALLERGRRGVPVVPILWAPCTWESEDYGQFQPLPQDRKPLRSQPEREAALAEVAAKVALMLVARPGRSSAGSSTDDASDPASYVPRPSLEAEAKRRLSAPRRPLVVQAPRHFGKSTLVTYLLSQAPGKVARINFADFAEEAPRAFDSLEALLRHVGRLVLAQLGLPQGQDTGAQEVLLDQVWARPGAPKDRLGWLLSQHVLPHTDPLLLCIDQADRVWGRSYQHDFFSMLRGWVENHAQPWPRLRLLVTVATEPSVLESTDNSSFFLRAAPLELTCFDRAQVGEIAQRQGRDSGAALLDWLQARTLGHPDLVFSFFEAGVEDQAGAEQVFRQHLRRLQTHLQSKGLLGALCHAFAGQLIGPDDYAELYRCGVLLEEEDNPGMYRPRCPLYADYFGKLCKNMQTQTSIR